MAILYIEEMCWMQVIIYRHFIMHSNLILLREIIFFINTLSYPLYLAFTHPIDWMGNYITFFYMGVISCPCPYPDAGLDLKK